MQVDGNNIVCVLPPHKPDNCRDTLLAVKSSLSLLQIAFKDVNETAVASVGVATFVQPVTTLMSGFGGLPRMAPECNMLTAYGWAACHHLHGHSACI